MSGKGWVQFLRDPFSLTPATRTKWVRLALQRLVAVSASNFVLVVLSGAVVAYGQYADVVPVHQLVLFFAQETGVVFVSLLFYLDLRRIGGDLAGLARRGREEIEDKAKESDRNPYMLFLVLFLVILWNFWVIGRYINATGGIVASPFGQFAVTLLVLGQLMATSRLTMFIIFALGVGYVWGVLQSEVIFGTAAVQVPLDVHEPEHQFLAVTAVSLAMGYVVNQVGISKEK